MFCAVVFSEDGEFHDFPSEGVFSLAVGGSIFVASDFPVELSDFGDALSPLLFVLDLFGCSVDNLFGRFVEVVDGVAIGRYDARVEVVKDHVLLGLDLVSLIKFKESMVNA